MLERWVVLKRRGHVKGRVMLQSGSCQGGSVIFKRQGHVRVRFMLEVGHVVEAGSCRRGEVMLEVGHVRGWVMLLRQVM